jgi:diguanylate cyclase (GGDEF)-like protein
VQDFEKRLSKLHRRDWWLWLTGAFVMLLLTAAVVSFTMPTLFREQEWFFQFNLNQAVRGLVGVVLLFNTYAIYQQVMLKRLHRELARQIERTSRLETETDLLSRLALLDPLTGLFNRRVAEDRLRGEIARSERHGYPLSVILFDLNDFKHINDTMGHAAGDEALKAFADRLRRVIRPSDAAVRLGGDEFLLLLPECPENHTSVLLERIGEVSAFHDGARFPVRYSAGTASFHRGESVEQLLARADQTLYAAKRAAKSASAERTSPAAASAA